MPDPTEDKAVFLARFGPEAFRYRDNLACSLIDGDQGYLIYTGDTVAAGAIGKAQGEALLAALDALQGSGIRTLELHINSSGAHFQKPMEGLWYLNAFLEALWALHASGVRIITRCDGWLYGGMAMALTAVSDEIMLGEKARIGLLGYRAATQ
jgi:acetyl-CoA carboxylase beta subunit